jgi:hypothetical protein
VPGIGTIHGFRDSNQASAICAGVAPFRAPISSSRHGLVRLASLRREPGQRAAIVVGAKPSGLIDLARKEAPVQWAIGYEADPKLLANGQHVLFRRRHQEGVLALERSDRLDRERAPDGLLASLG